MGCPMTKILGRLFLVLVVLLIVLIYLCFPYVSRMTDRWLERDLEVRSQIIFGSIHDDMKEALAAGDGDRIRKLFQNIAQDGHLFAIGFCDRQGALSYRSANFPSNFLCGDNQGLANNPLFIPQKNAGNKLLIAKFPLLDMGKSVGTLIIINDLGYTAQHYQDVYKIVFGFLLAVCLVAVLATLLIAYMTLRGWLRTVRILLQTKNVEIADRHKIPSELKPLVLDLYRLLRRRSQNRQSTNPTRNLWTAPSLQHFLETELPKEEIIIVSNREPYVHNEESGNIILQTPAGGLVSALEPVMRACKGTWIAHGSGSADKSMVDSRDHLAVPPENPSYTLRRVWLSEEEEAGYYHGFANEGLWPLCHMVFTRPVFREENWRQYQAVNRKFADAVVAEAKSKSPIILVQDYHFALLPALIHERLPGAIVATFWHIPWPNAEAFSICPFREEILKGLLGSDILGFHTQFHCNNFFDTVDRFLECRIDRERTTATRSGHTSLVRPYPISIEWLPPAVASLPPAAACRENVIKKLQLPQKLKLGVGVERFDYTKGIVDRFQAIARFFRQNPSWIGKFSFIQVAAPTRSNLPRYREIQEETIKLVETINEEFGRDTWKPIILIIAHYNQPSVFELFRAADFCIVSSLHDGMNLVAKEFVAAREDERSVLILSTFAGASEELLEALIVNPHDTKGMADSIYRALHMSAEEQEQRMRLLRRIVRDHNVYWWAGKMLRDVARTRKSSAISAATNSQGKYGNIISLQAAQSTLKKFLQNVSIRKNA